jgi:glucosyl-3-phosphoglycerate synthase
MPPARTAARPARRSTRVRRPRVPEPARVSVVIPVLNESRTIADVVRFALDDPHVGEVLVVDDGSHDGTPELAESAGARVITSSMLGKGASMEDGMRAAKHDIVLYLDGDLHGLTPGLVTTMAQPLVAGYGDLVKARFARTAGRVTVLTARPLLRTYFPELSGLNQPLGGIMAARRSLLEQLRFENDYGVDIGLLIDAAARGARIVEVDIGRLEHDSQSLDALGQMAVEVARTIVERAAEWGRLQVSFVRDTHERARRQRATSMGSLLSVVRGTDRLALFDMDGTLLDGRFVVELARQTRRGGRLARLLDSPELDPLTRTRQIAALFRGVSKYTFMQVAREMPLTAGAIDAVVGLRRKGYVVGLVTDSYHIAASIVQRRVFADFCIAHVMRFRNDRATGAVTLAPSMRHRTGCEEHRHCKLNVLRHFTERAGVHVKNVLAVGDSANDICMLKAAGQSVAFQPKTPAVAAAATHVVTDTLAAVVGLA